MRAFFGIGLRGACPLAKMSNIYIDTTNNGSVQTYRLNPPPKKIITSLRGGQINQFAVYDIRGHAKEGMFSIASVQDGTKSTAINYPAILSANRYIIGS